MLKNLVLWVVRRFAGRVDAAIASGIVWISLRGLAWVTAHVAPQYAALYDAQGIADKLTAFVFATLNIAANVAHQNKQDELSDTIKTLSSALQNNGVQIPVKRAIPLR